MTIISPSKTYIILVNFNGWKDTAECIESLLHLRNRDFQIVVVDNCSPNCSTDRLAEYLRGKSDYIPAPPGKLKKYVLPFAGKPVPFAEYGLAEAEQGGNRADEAKLSKEIAAGKFVGYCGKYPVAIIQAGTNSGFTAGNNTGARYAFAKNDASYFWFLNNDMIADPASLDKLIETAGSKNGAGARVLVYHDPETIQALGGSTGMSWKSFGHHLHEFTPDCPEYDGDFEIPGYIHGGCMFFPAAMLKDIGLFDEALFMWAEDSDLSLRAVRAGYKLVYSSGARVWHKEGGSTAEVKTFEVFGRDKPYRSVSRDVITVYYHLRNHLYLTHKHFPGKTVFYFFLRSLPFAMKKLVLILFFNDFKWRRMKLVFRGLWDGVFRRMGKRIDPYEYAQSRKK
ncbi:MAG: hypothetical protein A2Y33_07145 [Spirochaetes bacterium GWF1_51_8]|nr:MAG: hypothetical protein A2Y33_07145 [Spirochaetes bacterium GWF1_51_8]